MKINLGKSKSVTFTRAGVKDPLNYSLGDQKIPEASSFKYLRIICRSLNWADQVNYTVQKAWKALYFLMCLFTKGNSNITSLAYTLLHLILQYRAVCWEQCRQGQVITLDRVQKKVAKFTNHMDVSVLETLAQDRKIPHICALFKNWRTGMESYWGLVTRTMLPQQGRLG